MAVIPKATKPSSPAFICLIGLTIFLDAILYWMAVPTLIEFTKGANIVKTSPGSFRILGMVGFNLLPVILLIVYIRQDFKKQIVETILLYSALVLMVLPMILGESMMFAWADLNGYKLQDVKASERATAGANYFFEKSR